jgi:hypothetical protein
MGVGACGATLKQGVNTGGKMGHNTNQTQAKTNIVRIDQMIVGAVNNINVPAHEAHLQAKDGLIGTILRQDKLDCVAIHPNELSAVAHVTDFIHCPIPAETFA